MDKLELNGAPFLEDVPHAMQRIEEAEEAKMTEGYEETLPPMTLEEADAFFNAEDEALKEDRGDEPVADQLEDQTHAEIARLADFLLLNFSNEIEGSAVDTAIKIMLRQLSDGQSEK